MVAENVGPSSSSRENENQTMAQIDLMKGSIVKSEVVQQPMIEAETYFNQTGSNFIVASFPKKYVADSKISVTDLDNPFKVAKTASP